MTMISTSIISTFRLRRRPLLRTLLRRKPFSNEASLLTSKERKNKGAYRLLAALEQRKEADGVQVARLVSSLETLLPMAQWEEEQHPQEAPLLSSEQHVTSQPHTTDPAFFQFPVARNPHSTKDKDKVFLATKITSKEVLQLLQATRQGKRISLDTVEALIRATKNMFWNQPKVVKLPPLQEHQSLTVVGDLHGSLADLEAVLGMTGEPANNNLLLFNGDLADRGDHGIEVISVVCALFLAFPKHVYINRGNHEDLALSVAYGLASEIQHKYNAKAFRQRLGPLLDAFYGSLPLATIVEKDALIVHAGPPPPGITLGDVEQYLTRQVNQNDPVRRLSRTIRSGNENSIDSKTEEIVEALLWSDPDITELDGIPSLANYHGQKRMYEDQQIELLGWRPNKSRGAGFKYDADIIAKFLQMEGLSRIVRSHEPVHDGCAHYAIENKGQSKGEYQMEFFTVFSASRYPYKEGFNRGAVLKLQSKGKHRIVRYETEDDEPRAGQDYNAFRRNRTAISVDAPKKYSDVSRSSLRRALREAIAPHRKELKEEIQIANLEGNIPFHEATEVLVSTLKLDELVSQRRSPRLALARALTNQCHNVLPDTIDLCECIDELMQEMDVEMDNEGSGNFHPEMAPHYPWLRAVFEVVDVDHDGVISREEWLSAVATINAGLPEESTQVNAIDTWNMLDLDSDGHISAAEWNELARALCR